MRTRRPNSDRESFPPPSRFNPDFLAIADKRQTLTILEVQLLSKFTVEVDRGVDKVAAPIWQTADANLFQSA